MRLSLRMSTLLTGFIVLLLSLQAVDSLSLSKRRPQALMLPLTRVKQRTDIHPQIVRGFNFKYSAYSK